MPVVLGISAFTHDSAAALVDGGGILAACAEERFSRDKHDRGFPVRAIAACLELAGRRLSEVDRVVFFEDAVLTFDRVLSTWLAAAPRGFPYFAASVRPWTGKRLFQVPSLRRQLRQLDPDFDPGRLSLARHHESHAASAFFPSPFERAAVLTLDGVGEWATTTLGVGRGSVLEPLAELHHPHSLGLLYSTITAWCGFRVNNGEYKLMGLAPYGSPRFTELLLDEVVHLRDDGSYCLNARYFDFTRRLRMGSEALFRLTGVPRRTPEAPLTQGHRDLAASVQRVTEEVVLHLARHLHARTGEANLCLAGGVALNGVANGRLVREGPFERIWVQPAAGDDGGALGAALLGLHGLGVERRVVPDAMQGARLGTQHDPRVVEAALVAAGLAYEVLEPEALRARVVEVLVKGGIVGWFQGRMEYGPRALGARSILADARPAGARDRLNAVIKQREAFRPFAPVVLEAHASDWFDLAGPSPFMSFVVPARQAGRIPSAVHVDGTARVQTVAPAHVELHPLLEAFHERTGVPVLLNTSFNVRGEPIVEHPRQAIEVLRGTALDGLAIGPCWVPSPRGGSSSPGGATA